MPSVREFNANSFHKLNNPSEIIQKRKKFVAISIKYKARLAVNPAKPMGPPTLFFDLPLIIQQLKQDFYIITYDVRGAGQSSIPARIRDYRLEQLSLDLESVVNAVLKDRPFHLAAHD